MVLLFFFYISLFQLSKLIFYPSFVFTSYQMAVLLQLLGLFLASCTNAAPQEAPSATSLVPSSTAVATPQLLTLNETATLFELHEELVNIPSVSDDEIECSEFLLEYLKSYLAEFEFAVDKVPVDSGAAGRFNVFAYPSALQEAGEWPEVLISSHIDTVHSPIYMAIR
jgi:acetylornithine deacetylase